MGSAGYNIVHFLIYKIFSHQVEIHVLDCNDNYPVFLKDSYEFNIPENMTWSGVMNISATDRDEGLNAALVYSLQDDFGRFNVLEY